MRLSPMKGVRRVGARLRRLASAEDGSFLVESMVSAVIIVIVGVGVIEALDRGTRLGGQQEVQAVAGNVAQSEQEGIRGLAVSAQSNMRRESTREVGGVTYSIFSRADWVDDDSGDANCTTADSSADYMKLSTVVTWPQMGARKPVTLDSLITPGVRAFGAGQGSLAVKVSDRNGVGVSGLQLGLAGGATLSDPTNDAGCVLWGYLPAGGGYTVSFSRPPDYVTPAGSQVAAAPVTVVGGQTSNIELQYDRGGRIETSFITKRTSDGTTFPSNPKKAHVTNTGGVAVGFPVTSAGGTSGLLFPFTSAYTVHADTCPAARVPFPVPVPSPSPATGAPAAPEAVVATVTPGTTTTRVVQLPAINVRVRSGGAFKAGMAVRVKTPCGTVYDRTTLPAPNLGAIDDPGFPYAENLDFCAYDGSRHQTATKPNSNYNVGILTISIVSTSPPSPPGPCP